MKYFIAILLSIFLINTTQAETLIISGKFKTVISAKGVKPQKNSGRDQIYLYEDGTFDSSDGEDYGTYTSSGNTYTLSYDDDVFLNPLTEELEYEDLYIDSYTPFQSTIKLNKNRTKAKVKMNINVWVSDYYGETTAKVSIKGSCDCKAKQRP